MDYISIISLLATTVLSIIAIYVAVSIPKHLDKKQREFAKWEKRWDLYQLIKEWHSYIYNKIEEKAGDDGYSVFIEGFTLKFGENRAVELKTKCEILQEQTNILFDDLSKDLFYNAIGQLALLSNTELDYGKKLKIISDWIETQDAVEKDLDKMRAQIEKPMRS